MAKKEDLTPEAISNEITKPETKAGPMMYVGPTIPGMAIQNCVYSKEPDGFSEACNEIAELRNLMIPVSEYSSAEKMIAEKRGYIFSAYKKAIEYKETRKGGR